MALIELEKCEHVQINDKPIHLFFFRELKPLPQTHKIKLLLKIKHWNFFSLPNSSTN